MVIEIKIDVCNQSNYVVFFKQIYLVHVHKFVSLFKQVVHINK